MLINYQWLYLRSATMTIRSCSCYFLHSLANRLVASHFRCKIFIEEKSRARDSWFPLRAEKNETLRRSIGVMSLCKC